ncbi:MAG: di-heme oxidoredictase family protein [Candidatus Methylumidiphilus sp.]
MQIQPNVLPNRRARWPLALLACAFAPTSFADEAPTGFDLLSNGMVTQAEFNHALEAYEGRDTIADGLGPVYNAQSCAECHQSPVTGSGSQVTVVRAGIFDGRRFIDLPGGSLVPDRAIDAAIQPQVPNQANVRTLRMSLNTLGDGYVEAIADDTLLQIAQNQPGQSGGAVRGEAVLVDVLEAPGAQRVGRFGWKDQHASLLSFSGDAYRNEVGITNPLVPTENTANGRSVAAFDSVADPEDPGDDIEALTVFMRASKAPPRDATRAASAAAQQGERVFSQIGCNVCHVPAIVTAPAGTAINGGTFVVPAALGNKTIHPYSDFLLHDVGTGDGIVQNGPPTTRNKVRTMPLWGLRAHSRLLHDGSALTLTDAVNRHRGEAQAAAQRFAGLPPDARNKLLAFLQSL